MAFVARSFERLAKHIPLIGKQAGKKNLYAEAFLKAKTTSDALTDIMKNEAIPIKDRFDLLTQAQSKEIRSLFDDFIAKKEQAKSDLIKMDTAEGNPKNTEIKGGSFITKQSPAPKSDLNVKISVDDWVRELSEINNNELSANLFILQNKHPELFKKPSDVYRLLKEIKNNPTHFFKNNRPDMALIVKVLEDGSVGKLGIVKESGYVGHLSKSTNKNEMDRLRKVNEKELKVGTPYPTLQRADINQVGPTAGAKSTFSSSDESIISQKDKNTKTINASPHIASGLLGGIANGADENGNVSPEEFAKGFIYALFGSKFSASTIKRISPELYNSILGLGKKMPQMAKDNPKLLTKIYGSAKSNSINSFAGEKALNASANKLSKAKAMLEKGADEVEIWQKTGWFKDKDGAWKFEIGDSKARLNPNFKSGGKLGELLEHEELFKAYPELKDISVKKINDEGGEKLGYYDPRKKEIALSDLGDKSTLMHEVQHAIQDIEGFAKGGEYDIVWNAAVRKIEKKYESELAILEKIENEAWKKTEPLQKAYIELFDKGLKDSPEAQRLLKEQEPYFKKGQEAKNKIRNIKWAIEDEKNAITDKDMYEAYQKIHGEVEARNVQNRLNLDDAAGTHPHETFDVNPNETFVSREDGISFSVKDALQKEKRGVYNVAYNGKFSTPVYKDLTTIDYAIKYAKGDKSKGAKHISIRHLNDESKEGYVTRQELLSLGENIRAYLKENKEPFIDKKGGHIYEWEDKDGVRFRAVIG